MVKLIPLDYTNLLTIANGIKIADSPESITRLKAAGLINKHQNLLPTGHDKIEALRAAAEQIRAGLPLSKRITHRTNDAIRALDKKVSFYGVQYYYNDHVVLAGDRPELIYAREDSEAWKRIKRDVKRIALFDTTSWFKLEPYAVQRASFVGPELICLRGVTQPERFRVQSCYFDYLTDQFKTATWWFAQRFEGLAVRLDNLGTKSNKIMKNNTVAIVMPVASELEFPEF